MMKDGVLYTKEWKDVDDVNDYRIISTKTSKKIPMENRNIQMLDWVPAEDDNDGDTGWDDGETGGEV